MTVQRERAVLALLPSLFALQLPSSARCRHPTLLFRQDASPEAACSVVPTLAFRKDDAPEAAVPDVALTRSRDGSTGTATFRFDNATVLSLDDVWDNGLLTGLWLRDEEGELHTRDLDVEFERGRPARVVAILVLKSVQVQQSQGVWGASRRRRACGQLCLRRGPPGSRLAPTALAPRRRSGSVSSASWRDTPRPTTCRTSAAGGAGAGSRAWIENIQGRGRVRRHMRHGRACVSSRHFILFLFLF